MTSPFMTWILTDYGKTGTYSQCLGVAQGLGVTALSKTVKARWPWRLLPPTLWFRALQAQKEGHDPLAAPWPDLLIAAGRASMAPALAIKKSTRNCFTIILQNPYMNPSCFDCVIAPCHDHLEGSNVLPVLGSLHRLTSLQINAATEAYPALPLQRPVTTLLLGGDSRHYRYKMTDIERLANILKKIGGHFLITPSRRTRSEVVQALQESLKGLSYELWQGLGTNPYLAYLGLADQIIVTGDSISLASEACFTGKRVYVLEVNHQSSRFHEFYQKLYSRGYAKPLAWPLLQWKPQKLDEMSRAVEFIRQKIPLFSPL